MGSLRDREVACSASDRQGSNFESCVWRTVSSQSSHHPQEVLLAQFSLYVHKGGLKPDSFHFYKVVPLPIWISIVTLVQLCNKFGAFNADENDSLKILIKSEISNIRGFEWNFRPFIKIIFCYDNLLAAILKMVNLTMSGQYFPIISYKNDAVS